MMAEQALLPDEAGIRRDLSYMTARWRELGTPVVFEVRAFKEFAQPQTAKFAPDWIDEAVEWIVQMNGLGYNIYCVRNPIRHDVRGSATDADIVGSFFLWADCDEPSSAENVRRWDGPKYSATVVTGRTPAVRVHTYWQLAEPCTDMALWRETQASIAAHFGSDRTVINPSRIMRVGGTVSYPAKNKLERGYVKELTAIRTEYADTREPVKLDQMRRAFGAAPAEQTGPRFEVDTGPQPLDRERLKIQAMQGTEWHNAVIRLVGSYVAKGLSDSDIHTLTAPLTLAGYTVEQTAREVQVAIDGARRKGWTPEQSFTPNFDHAPAPSPSEPAPDAPKWRMQTAAEFTADFVSPEYIVDGVVRRGMLYTLTAPTGSGKTAVMLYAAAAIAQGQTFHEREVEGGDVLFMAGENPDDVRARMIGTMEFYGIDPKTCRIHFIPGTFSIRADLDRIREETAKLPNLVLIVIDTFAAYFDGDDENSNAQALDFARVARKLTALPSKPAVIMPAHPVKNATKGNLSPKGGSSLVNEVDGNLTLWNDSGIITLHWQTKYRGTDFEPLSFELQRFETERLKDAKGRLMPTILAKPLLQTRALQISQENMKAEDKLLLSLETHPAISYAQRAVNIGVPHKQKVVRMLEKMEAQKLVRRFRTNWELTSLGEKAVEMIKTGGSFAPEI